MVEGVKVMVMEGNANTDVDKECPKEDRPTTICNSEEQQMKEDSSDDLLPGVRNTR